MLLHFKLIAISFAVSFVSNSQANTVASGGNASGSGGSVSYSVGQIDYSYQSGTNGNLNQGVQQPYEIFATNSLENLGENIQLSIGPNPTTNHLILTIEESNMELDYILFDLNGKELTEKSNLKNSEEIDLSKYPSGMYHLIVRNQKLEIKAFKIIKN